MDGLNLVATWTEPFSLEGEEISYVVTVTNIDSKTVSVEYMINVTRFVFTQPVGGHGRNCKEFVFTVFSRNDFSNSITTVKGAKHIPSGKKFKHNNVFHICVYLINIILYIIIIIYYYMHGGLS